MPILKQKKTQNVTKTLTLRLPNDLIADVDKIRADADAKGLNFDVSAIVSEDSRKQSNSRAVNSSVFKNQRAAHCQVDWTQGTLPRLKARTAFGRPALPVPPPKIAALV